MISLVFKPLAWLYGILRPILALFFNHHGRHRVRVALRHGDDVLLVVTSFSRQLPSLAGGGIEAGETPAQAAVREVREETGMRITVDQLQHIGSFHLSPPALPFYIDLFECQVDEKKLPRLDVLRRLEIIDRTWVNVGDIDAPDQVLEYYLNRDRLC